MTRLISARVTALVTVLAASVLPACSVYAPANTDAQTMRAIFAAQTVPPQARPARGSDGAAAVAAYTNYQHSYVTPVSHSDSAAFGSK